MKAQNFLATALNAMEERAQLRDSTEGERSMAATVKAFNAIRKTSLTEEDGWAFMVLLKLVRSTNGKFHADDYVDGAAYFGLLGEAAEKERLSDKPLKTGDWVASNYSILPVTTDAAGKKHYGIRMEITHDNKAL